MSLPQLIHSITLQTVSLVWGSGEGGGREKHLLGYKALTQSAAVFAKTWTNGKIIQWNQNASLSPKGAAPYISKKES